MHVEVRGQHSGAGSLLPPCRMGSEMGLSQDNIPSIFNTAAFISLLWVLAIIYNLSEVLTTLKI